MNAPGGPGFFAVDRKVMRDASDELADGPTFTFFLFLAADQTNGRLPTGSVRDIARAYHFSMRGTERMLRRLTQVGWIEWVPPSNQYAEGHVRVLLDLERVKRPTFRDALPVPTAEPTEARDVPAAVPAAVPHAVPHAVGTAEPTEASRGNGPYREPRTENLEPEPKESLEPPHPRRSLHTETVTTTTANDPTRTNDEVAEAATKIARFVYNQTHALGLTHNERALNGIANVVAYASALDGHTFYEFGDDLREARSLNQLRRRAFATVGIYPDDSDSTVWERWGSRQSWPGLNAAYERGVLHDLRDDPMYGDPLDDDPI